MNRYAELESALKPLLKERTAPVLAEALARLGKPPEALEAADLERILKRVVFPELQKTLPADQARRRVEALLAELTGPSGAPDLAGLEAALKAFGLYIDWPEVQRLRRLVGGLRAEWNPEQAREAQLVVEALREKLESRLVQQAREIAELRRHFERVKKVGGRKVRRLASLLEQIEAAQAEGILAPAEVERARGLAAELMKLVESSVVEPVGDEEVLVRIEEDEPLEIEVDLEQLAPEQQDRIREIERGEEARRLETLLERYRPILTEELAEQAEELRTQLAEGALLGEALEAFHRTLEAVHKERLAEARARYEWIAEKLRSAEQKGAPSASLWAQLAAVAEALTQGLYPEGIEELEREVERLLAQAEARAEAESRARALAEEARRFAEAARDRIDPARDPELAAGLARLLAQAEEGAVDEALFARLKEALPRALADRAQVLWARLQAVPRLGALAGERAAVEAALEEGALEVAEERLRALEAAARARVAAELERAKVRARRFGVGGEWLEAAEAELVAGRFPELKGLETRLEEAIAGARRRARTRLARLRSLAERYQGIGGEVLLERLAEAEEGLAQGLPDFEALEAELAALEGRREALRKGLADRYARLSEGFARYKHLTGETRSRLGALMGFLEEGFARLDRLGTEGLLELDRALSEAEPLLDQLAEEYRAARELAAELEGRGLEELLGVFDAPEAPAPAAPDYRIRGVLAVARLAEGGVEGALPVDPELLEALKHELFAAGRPRLYTLYLPDHVLVHAFLPGGERVVLAEKPLLNRVLGLVEKERG